MSLTYIDSNTLPHTVTENSGEFTEIINQQLCGAKNVVASLRWLNEGDRLKIEPDPNVHQLVYVMAGEGAIVLPNEAKSAHAGSGVYLGPSEEATIHQKGQDTMKLLHLVVLTTS